MKKTRGMKKFGASKATANGLRGFTSTYDMLSKSLFGSQGVMNVKIEQAMYGFQTSSKGSKLSPVFRVLNMQSWLAVIHRASGSQET